MSDIHSEIQRLRSQIAEYRQRIILAEAELRGMERALSLISPSDLAANSPQSLTSRGKASQRRGGRQPGAISTRWQKVLRHFYGGKFDLEDVVRVVYEFEERHTKPSEVKRIFEGYIEHGYVEDAGGGLYRVSDAAAQRYNFSSHEKGPDETSEPNSNAGDEAERSIETDSKTSEPGSSKNTSGSAGSKPVVSAPFNRVKSDLLAGTSPFGADPTTKFPWER
ncbi:hypothetical protein ACSSV1_001327 [Labrenzia sp. MBR-25]